jgi:hypothetical protein
MSKDKHQTLHKIIIIIIIIIIIKLKIIRIIDGN